MTRGSNTVEERRPETSGLDTRRRPTDSRADARPGRARSRHGGIVFQIRGSCAHSTRTCPPTCGADSGPETAMTRPACVTCAMPSWIHCPRPARRLHGRGACRSGGRDCRRWQAPVRPPRAFRRARLSVPSSERRSTRSPPSSTASGRQRVAASSTCRHSVSERPFLRWMSLTYSSRHASGRVDSRSSRICRACVSPISSGPDDNCPASPQSAQSNRIVLVYAKYYASAADLSSRDLVMETALDRSARGGYLPAVIKSPGGLFHPGGNRARRGPRCRSQPQRGTMRPAAMEPAKRGTEVGPTPAFTARS